MAANREEETESEGWSDAEEDFDQDPVVAITSDQTFGSAKEALEHDTARGFDLIAFARQLGLDFYGAVRLVNARKTKQRCS